VGPEGIGQGRHSSGAGPDLCTLENSSSIAPGPRRIPRPGISERGME
jgi:hypothetical protein